MGLKKIWKALGGIFLCVRFVNVTKLVNDSVHNQPIPSAAPGNLVNLFGLHWRWVKTAINVTIVCLSAVSTEDSCFVISRFRFLFVILSSLVYSFSARSLLDRIRAAFPGAFGQEVPSRITGFWPVKVENVVCFVLLSSRQTSYRRNYDLWIHPDDLDYMGSCDGEKGIKRVQIIAVCEANLWGKSLSMVSLSGDERRSLPIHPRVWWQLIITCTQ